MPAATAITTNRGYLQVLTGTFVLDIGSILTAANEDSTIAIPDANVGDLVIIAPRAPRLDGLILANPHVDSDGSVTFTVENNSASTRDEASATYDYAIIRGITGSIA